MSPELRELNRNIKKLLEKLETSEEPVCEAVAADKLGISIKTLQNNVYKGRLTDAYTVNMLGQRMYYLSKLFGNSRQL